MRPLRSLLAASALLALSAGAAAATSTIPTPIALNSRSAIQVQLADLDDVAVFSVTLVAGKDYVIGTASPQGVQVTVLGPRRGVIADKRLEPGVDQGLEFRPLATGTHVIKFAAGEGSLILVIRDDCKADTRTVCGLRLGVVQSSRRFDYPQDRDARRVRLERGRTYTVSVTDARAVQPFIEVQSSRGVPQSRGRLDCRATRSFTCTLRFTAAYTGDYVIVTGAQSGNPGLYAFLMR